MPQDIKQAEICVSPNLLNVFDLGSLLSVVADQEVGAEIKLKLNHFHGSLMYSIVKFLSLI